MAASRAETDRMIKDKLDGLIAKWIADGFTANIQLFETNVAITVATVLSDLVFASWTGGEAQLMDFTSFAAAVVVANIASVTDTIIHSWTNTDVVAGTAWGYAIFDDDTSELLCAENFGAAVTVAIGGTQSVQAKILDRSADF